jgi:hypothetical protein
MGRVISSKYLEFRFYKLSFAEISKTIPMEPNKILRNQIIEVVNNQIRSNAPPETKQTLKRLVSLGYSDLDAKKLIGECILSEMSTILKEQKPFNIDRYVSTLKNLPHRPSDEQ